jgi:hypothetical protein
MENWCIIDNRAVAALEWKVRGLLRKARHSDVKNSKTQNIK